MHFYILILNGLLSSFFTLTFKKIKNLRNAQRITMYIYCDVPVQMAKKKIYSNMFGLKQQLPLLIPGNLI